MTYYKGDTLRLKAAFYNFAGEVADLAGGSPTLKIYDDHQVLLTTVAPASITKEAGSTGVYYYDYTTTQVGKLTFEYSGSLESSPVLGRSNFNVEFV